VDDPRYLRLSLPILAVRGPRVLRQAWVLQRKVPRLPDADRPWRGGVDGPDPLRLLVLGDSTAAGVGVTSQDEGLPGHLGRALHRHTGRGVEWRAVGENGATTRDLLTTYLDEALAEPADLVFLTIGANDAIHARPPVAFRRNLGRILHALSAAMPETIVLMSSLPIFGLFGVFPDPLRTTLFRHSRNLERVARSVIARDPRWMISRNDPPPYADGFFATDQFHPSSAGYRDWADWAIDEAWERGLGAKLGVESGELERDAG
jgi:lysophospholipase L1-like esterase